MPEPRVPSDKVPRPPRPGSSEELQRALDPHRDEERRSVEAEVAARLRTRGVLLTGTETADEVADLLDAVDQFDAAVEAHGGDLFVDTPTALHSDRVEQPDNVAYVLPTRAAHEAVASYLARVAAAVSRLR
jgi:hypothetical protein